ncbi:hypothetical protein ABIE51_001723 [Lysobacter sp. OAE881]|uniref:hypothetical protein n=1 Tax=Lysobacter sp. OAE881 TaxID=2663813 RepID=UPI00178A6789
MKHTNAPPSFPEHERRALGRAVSVVIDRRLSARMEADTALREIVADLLFRIDRLESLNGVSDDTRMQVRRVTPFRPRPSRNR